MSVFLHHTYYNTYYYSNIVNNILDEDDELVGFISNFFADDTIFQLIKPFQKRTAFHAFIEYMVYEFFTEDMGEHDSRNFEYYKKNPTSMFVPYAEKVFENYGINDYAFDNPGTIDYSDVEEYHLMLHESGILEQLFGIIADEIFYLMFNNRDALLRFNSIASRYVESIDMDIFDDEDYTEYQDYFNKSGVLKRVAIPEWCKKAVMFRDNGRCCFCHQDLSGMLFIHNQLHYDHIVPLANGGLNDVVNIQLLCSSCNLDKGSWYVKTSEKYQRWF
ncbi:HNH endonuclease [Flavobacterium microcysteis]